MALESPETASPELGHLIGGRVLTRSAIWNLAGGIAPLPVAVLAIPIILRALGIDRFGFLTLAWALIGYFSLFDFGLGRALTQAIARALATGGEDDLPALVWSGLGLMGVIGLIGGLICIVTVPTALEHILRIPALLRGETLGAAYIASAMIPVRLTIGTAAVPVTAMLVPAVTLVTVPLPLIALTQAEPFQKYKTLVSVA